MTFITKTRLIWIGAIIILISAAILLTGKKPIPVKITEIKPGDLVVVVNATTTSTVKSETEVILSAQRTGRVVALPVREGDRIRAGSLICRLDLTEESVQSENVLGQSKANFEEAEKNLKRMEDLFNKGMVSHQDFDATRRLFEVSKSQYEAAKADVGVKQAYSVIHSPFNGIIAKKFTEVGELLLPGKQIATIVDPDRIYVLATIDEVDIGRLKLGQEATITVDAFPGEKFRGVIRRISPIVSGGKLETRTADVWIYFEKKDLRLKPGMSADIEVLISVLNSVISVPSQCVVEREGKKQVYVAHGNSLGSGSTAVAELRPVVTGETNWSFTEITKGLSAGDYVITTPEAEGLKDGAKVKVD
jgi:HlyD family secretion protein